MKKKLMFVAGADWGFALNRLPIAQEAIRQGYEVHLATGITDKADLLREAGLIVHPLPLCRRSVNPLREIKTLLAMQAIFRRERPDIVHLITIKPVLYGCIAARLAGVRHVVAAVTGLGYVFMACGPKASLLRGVVLGLYRAAFAQKNLKVIFQNPDDRDRLVRSAGLDPDKIIMIRGDGTDLTRYRATDLPEGVPIVVLPARMLVDKGIYEFAEAARLLRAKGIAARFCLVGDIDAGNPASMTQAQLDALVAEGAVEAWGFRTDIPEVLAQAQLVALPSYREGLPNALTEAAACARAVVTTDVPGCREAIEANITGLLVPVRDAAALAAAMESLLNDRERCRRMGLAGRALAEREFDIRQVVRKHLAIYEAMLTTPTDILELTHPSTAASKQA